MRGLACSHSVTRLKISLQVWPIWCPWSCCLFLTAVVFFCWTPVFWCSCCGRENMPLQKWYLCAASFCHIMPHRHARTIKSPEEYFLFWPTLEPHVSFCHCYVYCLSWNPFFFLGLHLVYYSSAMFNTQIVIWRIWRHTLLPQAS